MSITPDRGHTRLHFNGHLAYAWLIILTFCIPVPCFAQEWAQAPTAVYIRGQRIINRDMTESGGFPTQEYYQHFRVPSQRVLLTVSHATGPNLTASGTLGTANISTHSSEGEETKFNDALCLGGSLDVAIYDSLDLSISVHADAGFLYMHSSDWHTTRVREDSLNTGGELSLKWLEYHASVYAMLPSPDYRITGGIRALYVDSRQTRSFTNGDRYISHFRLKDHFSLFCEVEHCVTDMISLVGAVSIFDEVSFEIGAKCTF